MTNTIASGLCSQELTLQTFIYKCLNVFSIKLCQNTVSQRVRVSAGECYVCCIAVHPLLHRQKAFLPPNLFLFPKQLTTVNQDAHSTVALADVVSKTLSPTHRRIGLAGGNEKRSTRDVFKTISQFLPRKAHTQLRTGQNFWQRFDGR